MRIAPGNAQDIGARTDQQDSFGFSDPAKNGFVSHGGVAAVVADGMGGLAHGAKASKTAVHTFLLAYEAKIPSEPIPDALQRALLEANRSVCSLAAGADMKSGVGTTLAAVVIHDGHLYWISVGDSRVYLCHRGRATRITKDHIFGNELDESFAKGRISRAEALNHPGREDLTSYLGMPEIPLIDASAKPVTLNPDDSVVVCTDGLYRALSEEEIGASLQRDPHRSCEFLTQRALGKRQAHQDNITVVALRRMPSRAIAPSTSRALTLVLASLAVFVVAGAAWWFLPPRITLSADKISVRRDEKVKLSWKTGWGVRVVLDAPDCNPSPGATSCEVRPGEDKNYSATASRFGLTTASNIISVRMEVPPAEGPKSAGTRQGPVGVAANGGTERQNSKATKDQPRKPEKEGTIPTPAQSTAVTAGPASGKSASAAEDASQPRSLPGETKQDVIVNGKKVDVQPALDVKPNPNTGTQSPAATAPTNSTARNSQPVTETTTRSAPAIAKAAPPPPVIDYFRADQTEITRGKTTVLHWRVSGQANEAFLEISASSTAEERVNPRDEFHEVSPSLDTSYRLRVRGPGGEDRWSQAVSLTVLHGTPSITTFTVEPRKIRPRDAVVVRWEVRGASDHVSISNVGEELPRAGTRTLHPEGTTEYVLRAVSDGGEGTTSSKPTKVQVERDPQSPVITNFKRTPETIEAGHKVTVTWQVSGITTRVLLNGVPQLPSGSCTDYPSQQKRYTLTAEGQNGTDSQTLQVSVTSDASPQRPSIWRKFGGSPLNTCGTPSPSPVGSKR